jgi:hypothetical protein
MPDCVRHQILLVDNEAAIRDTLAMLNRKVRRTQEMWVGYITLSPSR